MIPLEELEDGSLYALEARNLRIGVFVQRIGGFIGLRYKFDWLLDSEAYWGPTHGTAKPIEDLKIKVPDSIPLRVYLGLVCRECGHPAEKVFEEGNFVYDQHKTETTCVPSDLHFTQYEDNLELFEFMKAHDPCYRF